MSLDTWVSLVAICAFGLTLYGAIRSMRKELKNDITELKSELKGDISSLRSELIGTNQRIDTLFTLYTHAFSKFRKGKSELESEIAR